MTMSSPGITECRPPFSEGVEFRTNLVSVTKPGCDPPRARAANGGTEVQGSVYCKFLRPQQFGSEVKLKRSLSRDNSYR